MLTENQKFWRAQEALRKARQEFADANRELIQLRSMNDGYGIGLARAKMNKAIEAAKAAAAVLGTNNILNEGSVL